jgi:pimeloyl-ACP methyl ester carboxylesterase
VVEDTQQAVTDSIYSLLASRIGPKATPIQRIHRGLTRHAYFWVHAGLATVTLAARAIISAKATDAVSIHDRPRLSRNVAVLNGFRGDRLHREGSALSVPMTLRQAGTDVPVHPKSLRTAYGSEHTRLAVFVHGLVETEHSWRYRARERWGDPAVSYGSRLAEDLGYLPVWVRYNSGLRISSNGAAFAGLLTALVDSWPQPVDEIVLVGHSMGGQVMRHALDGEPAWRDTVRGVVTLGCPREGAPLARQAAATERLVRSSATARWLGHLIALRSEGIHDLHDGGPSGGALPATIGQYAVLSTLTPKPTSPLGVRLGDGLVPVPDRHTVRTDVVGGLNHLDLLNHPRVYEKLRTWVAADSGRPATTGAAAR